MGLLAIELNDAGIVVAKNQELLPASPGYALLDRKQLIVGADAHRRAHLKPGLINNDFWRRLSQETLPQPSPWAQTYADLAYAHLAQIWEATKTGTNGVLFAVPGSFDKAQLGLLLGIAKALSIPVVGMVDAAVAAVETRSASGRLLHLEIQLHQTVLTILETETQERTAVEVLPKLGIVSAYESWAKLIADQFVRTTRFDPFHRGSTEQALYDELPAWLHRLSTQPEAVLEMQASDSVYSTTLKRDQLVLAAQDRYDGIVQRVSAQTQSDTVLQVSDRLAALPGLLARLRSVRECQVLSLKPGAAALGTLRHAEHIRWPGQSIVLVTRLPRPGDLAPSSGSQDRPGPARRRPTHVVYQGLAYPIGEAPLKIGCGLGPQDSGISVAGTGVSPLHCAITLRGHKVLVEDYSSDGTFVNGEKIEVCAVLWSGDQVTFGPLGEGLQLVAVVSDHEA